MSLYAFDGTWDIDQPGLDHDTNVVWFAEAYAGQKHYIEGIGTQTDAIGKVVCGATGIGGRGKVNAMLERFTETHLPGDRVDVVGFSRGAALALDFCHRLPKGVDVTFLGLWDCVPSFGVSWLPFDWLLGWKLDLAPTVLRAAHAMAMDERRTDFQLRRPKAAGSARLEEVWFRGVHGDVGGGFGDSRAPIALAWMFGRAQAAGVPLDEKVIRMNAMRVDSMAPLGKNADYWLRTATRKPQPGDTVHISTLDTSPPFGVSGPFAVVDTSGTCVQYAAAV